MSSTKTPPAPAGGSGRMRFTDLIRSFIRLWAWAVGGILLLAIVVMTAYSAGSGFFFSKPLAGDFEIVQFGVAIAAFCFLPLAQLTRANVIVDIFTLRAPAKAKAAMDFASSLVALIFAAVLLWCMSEGMLDYYRHSEYTPIIGIPLWTAYPPILFSLLLLVAASLITAGETLGLLPVPPDAEKPLGAEQSYG